MQYPQTRYVDTINPGISNSALSLIVASVPPTRTQGILTIGRLQSNTEDVYFTNVAGNTVTIGLRGLSQTALTLTNVAGNQKVHNANESLEITTHHNYDTNKVRLDENNTLSGVNTFSGNANTFTGTDNSFSNPVKIPGINDLNGNEVLETPATASAINQLRLANSAAGQPVIISARGDDTNISVEFQAKGTGVYTVPDGSLTKTNAAPTVQAGIANKKYVDDSVATLGITPLTIIAGENITAGDALYIKASDGRVYKTDAAAAGEAVESFLGFATTTTTSGNAVAVEIGPNVTILSMVVVPGSTYYLSNTPGAISTTPGTINKPVLIATSTTAGNIFPTQAFRVAAGTTTITAPGIGATQTTVVTAGFRPKFIEVWLSLRSMNDANTNGEITTFYGMFNGTSFLNAQYNCQQQNGDGGVTVVPGSNNFADMATGRAMVGFSDLGEISALGRSGDYSKVKFDISAISSTGATFRLANTTAGGTGSAKTSSSTILYKMTG